MADNNDLFPTEADLLATNYINQRHPPIIALAQTMIGQTESSTLIERAILFHRVIGYGVHRDDQSKWTGFDDSFVQFVATSDLNREFEQRLTLNGYGSFADIDAFYAAADQHGVHDRLSSLVLKLLFIYCLYQEIEPLKIYEKQINVSL
ncbi:unnamed protein product [Rotaria socialis]|uniref:Uncharacterized protein n=1 Tax=Rotaria socialis TaxID=392032 RepID=A0A818UHJ9_9BILA|nr:unnamed protein product [Rotaria socialis]CAF3698145.1 unnamed protein product [Rotaria socialis]CAF4392489.1 unnamed protein product [Rotaria socialis]CAF4629886.1 unnamed protein product [Rotaria socialis]CAF4843570.1 unnamed protein product [Rotaria socialis]